MRDPSYDAHLVLLQVITWYGIFWFALTTFPLMIKYITTRTLFSTALSVVCVAPPALCCVAYIQTVSLVRLNEQKIAPWSTSIPVDKHLDQAHDDGPSYLALEDADGTDSPSTMVPKADLYELVGINVLFACTLIMWLGTLVVLPFVLNPKKPFSTSISATTFPCDAAAVALLKYHHVVDQKCIYNREGSVEAGDEDTTTNHYRAYYCASEQLWRVFSWMQLVIIVIVISLVLARFILEAGKKIATIKTPPEDAEKTLTPAPPSAV